jgi:hypothetical protein
MRSGLDTSGGVPLAMRPGLDTKRNEGDPLARRLGPDTSGGVPLAMRSGLDTSGGVPLVMRPGLDTSWEFCPAGCGQDWAVPPATKPGLGHETGEFRQRSRAGYLGSGTAKEFR